MLEIVNPAMPPGLLALFALLSAVVAIVHVFFDIVPKPYPAAIGFGIPVAVAIAAALDRSSTRSIWLALLALSFAQLNALRFRAGWLIPVTFGSVAVWWFTAAWLSRSDQDKQSNTIIWWVTGTLLLILGVAYGPDIVGAFLFPLFLLAPVAMVFLARRSSKRRDANRRSE